MQRQYTGAFLRETDAGTNGGEVVTKPRHNKPVGVATIAIKATARIRDNGKKPSCRESFTLGCVLGKLILMLEKFFVAFEFDEQLLLRHKLERRSR